MAAPMDDHVEETVQKDSDTMCLVEATVTTGLEQIAREEAIEMLTKDVKVARGHIILNLPIKDVKRVLELRCVDNCSVMMTQIKKFPFSQDELDCMKKLRELVRDVDWEKGLKAWHEVFTFKNPIPSKPDHHVESVGDPISTRRINKPKKGDKSEQKGGNRAKGKWDNAHKRNKKKKTTTEGQAQTDLKGQGDGDDLEMEATETDGKMDVTEDKTHSQENDITSCHSDVNLVCVTKSVNTDSDSAQNTENTNQNLVSNSDSQSNESVICPTNKRNLTTENPTEEEPEKKQRVKTTSWDPEKPAFRVTCKRGGKDHPFDSMCAAANFGGAVNDYFKWNVDMTKFDIEIILNIEEGEVRVNLALTQQSLHKRNITEFGKTTLRPTVAANMLRLCKLQPGDVVCDPMCGTGSIPLESAIRWQTHHNLGGDLSRKILFTYLANIEGANVHQSEQSRPDLKLDIARWDSCNLPLRDNCVDVFITDLPFGIRSGSKRNNWKLYPGVLYEMARVGRLGTARACLLSQDQKCLTKVVSVMSKYWTRKQVIGFNLGGLAASLYVLRRTTTEIDKSHPLPDLTVAPQNVSPHKVICGNPPQDPPNTSQKVTDHTRNLDSC